MRKGVLVVNGSLRSEKFEELYRLLEAAAAARGAELVPVRNTELVLPVGGRMAISQTDGEPFPENAGGSSDLRRRERSAPEERDGISRGAGDTLEGDTAAGDAVPLVSGEMDVFAENVAGGSRTGRRISAVSGGESRPAPRRGLLFGAGSFGGMTLFGGAVSGLPGERSARAVERLLRGERGPGLSWEKEISRGGTGRGDAAEPPRRESGGRSARSAPGEVETPTAPEEGTEGMRPAPRGTDVRGSRREAGRTPAQLPEQLRGAEFVLFWDKDVLLARALERAGLPVHNSARAVELCDDKRLTHETLSAAGLPMPRTVMGPLVFGPCDFEPFARGVEALFPYPVVVKEAFGSFGAQVYLAQNRAELVALCGSIAPRPFLVSEFVRESAGRDLRLQVVGGRVVAAMERRGQEGDFRAGLTSGGKMFPFTPDRAAEALAVRAAEALGCDFAGVDLLFGEEGYLVCEVNSNAHFKNLLDLTGVNAAEPILDLALGRGVSEAE